MYYCTILYYYSLYITTLLHRCILKYHNVHSTNGNVLLKLLQQTWQMIHYSDFNSVRCQDRSWNLTLSLRNEQWIFIELRDKEQNVAATLARMFRPRYHVRRGRRWPQKSEKFTREEKKGRGAESTEKKCEEKTECGAESKRRTKSETEEKLQKKTGKRRWSKPDVIARMNGNISKLSVISTVII